MEGDGKEARCDVEPSRQGGANQSTLWHILAANRKLVESVQKGNLTRWAPQLAGCAIDIVLEYAWSSADYYEHWFKKSLTDTKTNGVGGNVEVACLTLYDHTTNTQHTHTKTHAHRSRGARRARRARPRKRCKRCNSRYSTFTVGVIAVPNVFPSTVPN